MEHDERPLDPGALSGGRSDRSPEVPHYRVPHMGLIEACAFVIPFVNLLPKWIAQ